MENNDIAENQRYTSRIKIRKLSFRLDQKRASDLEYIADCEGVTVSFIVRHLVCRYIEEQKRVMCQPTIV